VVTTRGVSGHPAAEPAPAAWQVAAQRVFTIHAGRYGQRRYAPNCGVKAMRWAGSGCAAGSVPVACVLSARGLVAGRHAPPRSTSRPLPPI
jgi:hypothetical protein